MCFSSSVTSVPFHIFYCSLRIVTVVCPRPNCPNCWPHVQRISCPAFPSWPTLWQQTLPVGSHDKDFLPIGREYLPGHCLITHTHTQAFYSFSLSRFAVDKIWSWDSWEQNCASAANDLHIQVCTSYPFWWLAAPSPGFLVVPQYFHFCTQSYHIF